MLEAISTELGLPLTQQRIRKEQCKSAAVTDSKKEIKYFVVSNGKPNFTKNEKQMKTGTVKYKGNDKVNRCGSVIAILDLTMLTSHHRSSSRIKPTGWCSATSERVSGKYVFNRCHLLGDEFGGCSNSSNLVTGTRYLNADLMYFFEKQVADYLRQNKDYKVIYKVTPVFVGDELLMRGIQIEALGKNLCFNVYLRNEQPGFTLNYKKGGFVEE